VLGHLSQAHRVVLLRYTLKFEVVGVHHVAELLDQARTVNGCRVHLLIRFVVMAEEVLVFEVRGVLLYRGEVRLIYEELWMGQVGLVQLALIIAKHLLSWSR